VDVVNYADPDLRKYDKQEFKERFDALSIDKQWKSLDTIIA
jgi:hypothetical protein